MSLMLDTVQIHIPFLEDYCYPVPQSKKWALSICVTDLDKYLNISARNIFKKNGEIISIDYYHPYDSIPTNHTGIGYKIMHISNNSMPHVILNCSIAKILQGHNVYGNTDMITGVCEMMGIFCENYDGLIKYLDFNQAYISKFDVTLPALTPSQTTAEAIREYFRYVDWGRYRNLSVRNKKLEYNTLYFGSEESKVGGFKIYCKGIEVDKVINELTTQAKRGNIKAIKDLEIYTKEVRDYASKSIRIECTCKKRMLKEKGLPTNLWSFLKYQLLNPEVYQQLFQYKTSDFLQSLEGMRMPYDDDIKVYDLLIKRLCEPTESGNISTTKAKNAYMFYKAIKADGFYQVKSRLNLRTFQRNVKLLCDAGFNRAYLQNLTKSEDTQIIRLLNVDMNAKRPDSYVEPVSNYYQEFEKYLIQAV